MGSIRIVQTPPGFAPEKIREEWVGIKIPLVPERDLRQDPPVPHPAASTNDNADGHVVLRTEAILALLNAGKEEAANFWNALPLGVYLIFKKDVCEVVE